MQTVQLDRDTHQSVAPNGLTILTERMPGVRSVSVGIWVRTATAHERPAKMGVSHLLEHMVFKGTERRSARELALVLEARGGSLDAYTARDHTTFHARALDEDLPRAFDVLTDLVRRPLLREADLALERNVVLEEISTVQDTPEDLIFDLHTQALWPDHSYGFPILGTRDTVSGLAASDLLELHRRAYVPANCVIAAAGSLEHQSFLELAAAGNWLDAPAGADIPAHPGVPPAMRSVRRAVPRETVQTHIVLGTDTFPYQDDRRYTVSLLVNVLGGGMSSRLFQRIREELGLAYAVYAFTSFYRASGLIGVYLGTTPATAEQAATAAFDEMRRLAAEGLSAADLTEAKQQLKGQVMLALESPGARMSRLAASPLYGMPYRRLEEILAQIDSITRESAAGVAAEFFAPDRQTSVWLGPN
jgi:predicted Zn-dependent peptidase